MIPIVLVFWLADKSLWIRVTLCTKHSVYCISPSSQQISWVSSYRICCNSFPYSAYASRLLAPFLCSNPALELVEVSCARYQDQYARTSVFFHQDIKKCFYLLFATSCDVEGPLKHLFDCYVQSVVSVSIWETKQSLLHTSTMRACRSCPRT